jgi:hypothetical protein
MNPPTSKLTPEQGERLRELYRKNFATLMLLSPEAVQDEFPKLALRPSNAARGRLPRSELGAEMRKTPE